MLKEYFLDKVNTSVKELVEQGKLGQMNVNDTFSFQTDIPKNTQFGDFAVNVASLARYARLAPPQIAQLIADNIKPEGFDVNVAAGFINFKLHNSLLNNILLEIVDKKLDYAKNNQVQK